MPEPTPQVRSELAPTGRLRLGFNMSNFLLTRTDETGKPAGLAVDLGRELGRRLGLPVEIIPYPNPAALADAAKTGVWDVGFLGAEPQRANEIDFTAAYVEIEASYLVPPGSKLQSIGEVDREGIRIAVPSGSAYALYLTRTLKHAKLVEEKGADNAFKRFADDKLDALAGLKPRLVTDGKTWPAHASWTGASPPCSRRSAHPGAAPQARSTCASSSKTSRRAVSSRRRSKRTTCAV